jgi:hypothetical protein
MGQKTDPMIMRIVHQSEFIHTGYEAFVLANHLNNFLLRIYKCDETLMSFNWRTASYLTKRLREVSHEVLYDRYDIYSKEEKDWAKYTKYLLYKIECLAYFLGRRNQIRL